MSVLERVACYRAAVLVLGQITALLQDVGIIDSRLGMLVRAMQDGEKVQPTPSGEELQKWAQSIVVENHELVSEAEVDFLHGDWAAHERAPREAAG